MNPLRSLVPAVVLVVVAAGGYSVLEKKYASDDSGGDAGESMTSESIDRRPPAGKNHLAFEKSPYLLQHADNPVDWYPWGEEAFARAAAEDRPVFLSIGYSTCHWCHVMEHESFEDEQVAALMNNAFICIKVDREERPDIDNIYMTFCQMTGRQGGWPLTVLLTPDKKPIFAATYIPKAGMLQWIPQVVEAWKTQRDEITAGAQQVAEALGRIGADAGNRLGEDVLAAAYGQLGAMYDRANGGFGSAPKFPAPHNLLFLLRYWKRTDEPEALEMVENTLEKMRRGGVYDHVGFGFHRYSTDARWFLPHFEKMLYDQALLAMAYSETYQATRKRRYRDTAEEIFEYVRRDMTDPAGGFYSAEDADSEGEEGKFYLWSRSELDQILGEKDAEVVARTFGVVEGGNWAEEAGGRRPGTNLFHLDRPLSEKAAELGMEEASLRGCIESAREKLFAVREGRVHPYKDDKILTDWNGLMIVALAKAARVFDEPRYAERAGKAVEFIMEKMTAPSGGLFHRYRDGEAAIAGMADDYAFFVWGLLEMYETTFDPAFLEQAIRFNQYLDDHFWDDAAGGYYFTADNGEELIVRSKQVYDGAIPSANSVAMLNSTRLSRITADVAYENRAADIGAAFAAQVSRSAGAHTMLMSALDFAVGPSFEIVIVGDPERADTEKMTKTIRSQYLPSKVVVMRPDGPRGEPIAELAPYTRSQTALDGKATAYVCRNFACELPTVDTGKIVELLGEN